MAVRRPLVIDSSGRVEELPQSDSLPTLFDPTVTFAQLEAMTGGLPDMTFAQMEAQ